MNSIINQNNKMEEFKGDKLIKKVRNNLKDIYAQAKHIGKEQKRNGYSYVMYKGFKIIKDQESKQIQILNSNTKGNYEEKLSKIETEEILNKGWKNGVINLLLLKENNKIK